MDARGLPLRTFILLVIGLFALCGVLAFSPYGTFAAAGFALIGGAILLTSAVLIPAVRDALRARLDTPVGRIISLLATVVFLLAAATCAALWWQYLPWNAEQQRPVVTPNQMAVLCGAGLTLALTGPIAWRWLAARLLSRPASSLAFFRTGSGPMRLLIVLSVIFVLLGPRLHTAMEPWAQTPSMAWLLQVLWLVNLALAAVVVLATLSGVSQLLLRCFGRRDPLTALR